MRVVLGVWRIVCGGFSGGDFGMKEDRRLGMW